MKITLENIDLLYDVQCVCLLFFPRVSFTKDDGLSLFVKADKGGVFVSFSDGEKKFEKFFSFSDEYDYFRTAVKLSVYEVLSEATGILSPWGIITGIRPAVLFDKLQKDGKDAEELFLKRYRVFPEKTSLCKETLCGRKRALEENEKDDVSVYISIPFCPSRCAYCSFVSSSTSKEGKYLPEYIDLLCEEIKEKKNLIINDGKKVTTLYIGGGTPSVLDENLMKKLLSSVSENLLSVFPIKEFTFEAGRPDTVNDEKLSIMSSYGVTRVSINPQTLNDDVLLNIGRKHTVADFYNAYNLAKKYPFIINTDIIAGLVSDTAESFYKTADGIISLLPDNITVHTLYLKRSSDFGSEDNVDGVKKQLKDNRISDMLSYIDEKRRQNGYIPYYLYKQKNTVENMENVGYAKKGKECFYNIYMMDDIHDIYGIGAGAVSKKLDEKTNKATRNSNTKFAYNYIKERTDGTEKQ